MAKQAAVKEATSDYELTATYLPVEDKAAALAVIFNEADVKHGLTLFKDYEVSKLTLWQRSGRYYVHCAVRDKKVVAKPEEIVRQLCIQRLLSMGYPRARIAVEVPVRMGSSFHSKAADIVVYREELKLTSYIVVEDKRPARKDGREQLQTYMNPTGAPFGWWTNGNEEFVWYRTEPNIFEDVDRLPNEGETLDAIKQPLQKSALEPLGNLRELVEDLEERVLANAGVSAFDEVFKLIFAKLWDEYNTPPTGNVKFRHTTETPEELKARIDKLFEDAKTRRRDWRGIFDEGEKIQLTAQALVPCVGALYKYHFFDSDLDVLDAAFEHLVNPEQKGDKGQYFTPRHVVRMCVRMLNPKEDERCLDPACVRVYDSHPQARLRQRRLQEEVGRRVA